MEQSRRQTAMHIAQKFIHIFNEKAIWIGYDELYRCEILAKIDAGSLVELEFLWNRMAPPHLMQGDEHRNWSHSCYAAIEEEFGPGSLSKIWIRTTVADKGTFVSERLKE